MPYQGAEIPTEEELEEILLTYFSFFGTEDLDTFLKNSYPDLLVSGLALEIGTTKLESSNKDTGNANANTNTKSSDDPNVGLIVGVVVGALAAVVLAGVSLRYRNNVLKSLSRGLVLTTRTVRSNRPPLPSCRGKPSQNVSKFQPREISPPPPMTPHSAMSSEQDARSLSGMVSLKNRYSQPMNPTNRVLRFNTTRVGSTKSYRVPRVLRKDSMEIQTTRSYKNCRYII
jgi:hypothetical protein